MPKIFLRLLESFWQKRTAAMATVFENEQNLRNNTTN
jgi:hypothetical protein